MSVSVYVHVSCVYACIWRPEFGIRGFPYSLSTLFFETGSLTQLELTDSANLTASELQGPG